MENIAEIKNKSSGMEWEGVMVRHSRQCGGRGKGGGERVGREDTRVTGMCGGRGSSCVTGRGRGWMDTNTPQYKNITHTATRQGLEN